MDAAQADIQALNRNRAELTKLQDNVTTSRALFEQLQSGEKTQGIMEQETAYIEALLSAETYRVVDGRLQLGNGAGQITLAFASKAEQ